MSMTTLAQVHAMLPGSQLLNISNELAQSLAISRVGSDSRHIEVGELFIALTGERFDAHQFLSEVLTAGVMAALISDPEKCPDDLPAICVSDTRKSLGELAKAWRSTFSLPLTLVTGSNGKTTVKEMIAAIFRAAVGNECVLVTQGNLNNEIGLPLTLLRLKSTDRLAVVELGMNHPGETAQLAALAQANIALINNAQREHQEFMNTVSAVAKEHAAAIHALPLNGIAVFPADSEFTSEWTEAAGNRQVIDFALSSQASHTNAAVSGRMLENGHVQIQTEFGSIEVQLNTLGSHNVRNALAASAVALAAGLTLKQIKAGLESFVPVKGRMQSKNLNSNYTLIDDSYNANPDSVRAAIDALKQSGKSAWLVLGDMGEVGDQGLAFHKEVGAYAAEQGIAKLFALGDQSTFAVQSFDAFKNEHKLASHAEHFFSLESLLASLMSELTLHSAKEKEQLNILVKGSRYMRMERVVQVLMEEAKACS
ncbi:UDP-N-acetylmuramoyl-tripeptide--D-alanyl-D-alanine ligase [Polynucleobacter meluiroseus]|uniref:UDP-N-acetylmuramoyl-tripeptide--D-alanyl-D-alanine ligase n=1 Tax=Polynucleobacter meluiroseus TaxID=1938814 RepID=A0A240E377_9BURK|nr:UDP-N-acetylmuramoyl-tripeptide--D-alanyl-D-alanine ligase [Polynucleobacter meluiroseus]SNX28961.1 UDP-N-acetylmuramoyl-tripeptide--D-alanyl-D-alanine ligase [Polynucleobacter meluiroseus]